MRRLLAFGIMLSVSCVCRPEVGMVEPARLTGSPEAIDFPATEVGQRRSATLELRNLGGSTVAVALTASAPFSVSTVQLELGPGASQLIEVTFQPSSVGRSEGVLRANELEFPLRGVGLAAPVCRGAISCDDLDACTIDTCDGGTSCSHAPRACAPSTSPCQVASCDSASGCGFGPALDGTLCGIDDCTEPNVDVCVTGQCVARPRTDLARCTNTWVPAHLTARVGQSMAWDPFRQRVFLFGGKTYRGRLGDTWEWSGARWHQRTLPFAPPARARSSMVTDPVRNRVVLFGGDWGTNARSNDTWEWDGARWRERSPAVVPEARSGHAMAWDPVRKRVVLFGGQGAALLNDTWEWDGTNWEKRSPSNSPPVRVDHALAFDPVRGRMVLFGGKRMGANTELDDTWEWDGTDWLERSLTPRPSARASAALAWDPRGRTLLLHGGLASFAEVVDSWTFDGTAWTAHTLESPPVGASSLVYDEVNERLLLLGGSDVRVETWHWDGAAWLRAAARTPPRRSGPAMASDEARGRLILFGGSPIGGSISDEMWAWDGTGWEQLQPITRPSRRQYHSMTWDSVRQRLLLFGGFSAPSLNYQSDVWEWDGQDWSERTAGAAPAPRGNASFVFNPVMQEAVLIGGRGLTTTYYPESWTWNGTSWTELAVTSPPARTVSGAVWDGARQRVVLFGGYATNAPLGDHWEWDGTSWLQRFPSPSPSPRAGASLAFDSVRQRVVLFGGYTSAINAETWEWDGSAWLQRFPAVSPPPSNSAQLAYDSVQGRMVLYDGDTWLYFP